MSWARQVVCITCWRKLHGPEREPARVVGEALTATERAARCHLCGGPTDAEPGIFVRMWSEGQ